MKKTLILIAAAIMGFSTPILAQSDDNEKEITVTNAQGKKEVIDLPEAMTTEFDSLLSAYNNKTYLQISHRTAVQRRCAAVYRPIQRTPAPLCKLNAWRTELLHATV